MPGLSYSDFKEQYNQQVSSGKSSSQATNAILNSVNSKQSSSKTTQSSYMNSLGLTNPILKIPNATTSLQYQNTAGKLTGTANKQTGYTAEQKKRKDELEKQLSTINANAGYVTTTEQSDELEKQKNAIRKELANIDKEAGIKTTNYLKLAQGIDTKAGNAFVENVASVGSQLFGKDTFVGEVGTMVRQGLSDIGLDVDVNGNLADEWYQSRKTASERDVEKFAENANSSNVAQAVDKYGTMVWQQAPSMLLAFMTGGASAAATTTADLQFIAAFNTSGKAAQLGAAAANTLTTLAKNPLTWNSYIQESGNAYTTALEDGATPEMARAYAAAYGVLSSMVEMGDGGIEKLPADIQKLLGDGKVSEAAVRYAKSIINEVIEEEEQGMLERGLKSIYGKETPVYSTTNENAVINPSVMAETAIDTAITTALMGAIEAPINSALVRIKNKQQDNVPANADATNAVIQKDPKILDEIMDKNSSYSKAATEILNNPDALAEYEQKFGKVEGGSKTEMAKNLASALYLITNAPIQTEQTVEQPTPQINPLTGADHPMAQPVPTMTAEQSYMRGLIINMEVDEILSTPENIALYEEITGETLPRKADGTIDKKKADSQIIKTGRGTRSGETTISGNAINNNQQTNPVQTEQTATQETETQQAPVREQATPQTNPLNASAQAQPVANHVNAQNTTQNATQRQNPLNTQATQENASNNAQNSTNDIPTQPINTEPVEVPITPQNANTKPTGSTDTAPTQDSIAEDTFTPEQYAATGGQTEHTVIHDADVEAEAVRRINENREQATADILAKEDYDVYDVGVSNMLINEATEQLATNTDPTAVEGIVKKLAYLRKAREKAATKIGQSLRQLGIFKKFSGSPADIISDASMQLYGEESTSSLSPAEKSNVFNMIQDFANKLGNLDTANTQETIDLIHEVSEARKTTGSMSAVDSKLVDKALHKIATMEGGQEFLRNLLTVQIRSIAGDYNSKGAINVGKAIRYLWALSNPKTSVTNVGANTVFGEIVSVIDSRMSLPFDALLSMFTGKREVAFDKGLFSKETWQGASDALLKSMVEVALDAESDMADYAYDEIKGRTFKMSGNWMERFLSRLEMMQGFALKSTDQMAKGGVEAETKRGLNKLKPGNKLENAEIAKEEAKYRTLQNENAISKGLTQVKNWLNKIHLGSEKTGTYGLGDHFIMFAQVPANQVVTQLELQPVVGTAISAYKLCQMIKEGQNGGTTSKTQREAARALGKTVNGASIIGLSILMSATGCLRCVDEDDDDLAVMLKSMGKTGTQWNIDAFMRMVTGGDSKPRDGDTWISMNWVPQLNSLMIMGNALYRSKVDDGSISFGEALLAMKDGLVDSMADFPAVSGITSTVKSVKYAKYEGEDRSTMDEDELAAKDMEAKAGALLGNEVGNFVSGFVVPNAVRGIATGTDDTERYTYGTNNPLERAVNQVKSGIPGWRQTISPRLDNFGNEVKNEGGTIQFLNKTFLPGALSHDRSTVPQTLAESIYNETGDKDVIPDRKAPASISITKNGEKETHYLKQEEKTAYQKRYGEICDTMYLNASNNTKFAKLPADQQAEILKEIKSYAKGIATSEYKKSIGEDYENDAYYLTSGKDNKGKHTPALYERNLVDYLTYKNMLDTAVDNNDYNTIDGIVRSFDSFDNNLQAVFSARNSDINTYKKYADSGIGSKTVDAFKSSMNNVQTEEDTNSDGSRIKFKAIINADIPESEKEKLIAMEDNLSQNWKMVYDVLSDVGYSKQAVYDFFTNADWTLSQKSGEYEQNGQIGAYEAYAALQQENLTDEQRRYIFDAFAYATGEPGRYDNWSRLNKRTAEFIKYDYDYITRVAKNYGLDKYTGHNKAKAEAEKDGKPNPLLTPTSPGGMTYEEFKKLYG